MASKQLLPSVPVYIKVEIDFTNNWNTITPSYTDVTADLRLADGVSWERGKNQAWDQLSPGSFSFTLDNRAGTYEPATNSNMVGTRLCRITCYYPNSSSTSYVQFVGVIDQFDVNYPAYGKDQTVSVSGVDWLTSLWLSQVVSVAVLGTTSTSWYQAICAAAAIPTGYQSFTAGTFTMRPSTILNTDCLSALGTVANSQLQFLYVSKTGVLTSIALTSGSVTQTYDEASTYPYSDLKGGVGGTGTCTVVEINQSPHVQTQSGGANATITQDVPGSPLPRTKFGIQTLTLNTAPVTAGASLLSAWVSAVPSPATYWWKELQIRPLAKPATLIPAVLAAELGDRITIIRRPLQGGSISKNVSIRSIKHDIRGGDWTVTFGLTNR